MSQSRPAPEPKYKIFNDPIHGNIEVHPLCVRLIDTPQFQRLRHIKQLGACYLVFPGASHNRFEHSIGVSYLAGKLVEKLRSRQPELGITDVDVLCLRIAGLCHDLGQGPFSCVFEQRFIPHYKADWKPEEAAVKMFEHMVQVNNLHPLFEDERNKLGQRDLTFIKEILAGPTIRLAKEEVWPFRGRGRDKGFLYEIIKNKRNGMDVDKWDSLARDSKHLGIHSNFDYKRIKKFARVIMAEDVHVLCIRDKEVDTHLTMCQTFLNLSRNAYKHKTTAIIEYMIGEAFRAANDCSEIRLGPGGDKKMSEAVDDMAAFTELTDSVYYEILHSDCDELEPARQILFRIQRRQHYRCIGKRTVEPTANKNWETEICDAMDVKFRTRELDLKKSDIVVLVEKFNYGLEKINNDDIHDNRDDPVKSVLYFKKSDLNRATEASADQVSDVLPETYTEQKIFVYCKKIDKEILKLATECLDEVCESMDGLMRTEQQQTSPSRSVEHPTPDGSRPRHASPTAPTDAAHDDDEIENIDLHSQNA